MKSLYQVTRVFEVVLLLPEIQQRSYKDPADQAADPETEEQVNFLIICKLVFSPLNVDTHIDKSAS